MYSLFAVLLGSMANNEEISKREPSEGKNEVVYEFVVMLEKFDFWLNIVETKTKSTNFGVQLDIPNVSQARFQMRNGQDI